MSWLENPSAERAQRIHRRFGERGRDERYWKQYSKAIAALPADLRINGLLMTLALRAASIGADGCEHDVLVDLKWAVGAESASMRDWIDSTFASETPADLARLQFAFMEAAQQLKTLAKLRENAAHLMAAARPGDTGEIGPDAEDGDADEDEGGL